LQFLRVRHWGAATALFAGTLGALPPDPALALLVGPELPVSEGTFVPFGDVTAEFLDIVGNPFSSEYTPDAHGRFQQVYDASVFGNTPLSIEQIRFFEDLPSVGTLNASRFTIEIGTTTREVNQLACCANTATPFADNELLLDSNRGSNMQVFAQDVSLADVFAGGVLTFNALSAFVYDPSLGENLLLEISFDPRDEQGELVPGLGAGSEKFFVLDGPIDVLDPSVFSVADNQDGVDNTGRGLRTEFITAAVPEPTSALLLALGLVVLARHDRRSRG
jgi:PEP-CTERM motif